MVTILANSLKFYFSLRRPGQEKRFPRVKSLVDVFGVCQLGTGIWGMALVFPNLEYLSDPSPETCEMGPLIATLIPACIIALVALTLLVAGGLYLLGFQFGRAEMEQADGKADSAAEPAARSETAGDESNS